MTGISIEFPQKGLTFFKDLDELNQYLQEYEKYWSWLQQAAQKIGLYRNNNAQALFNEIGVSAVKKIRDELSKLPEDVDFDSDEVSSILKSLEKRKELIHLGTNLHKDIESYRDQYGDESAFCFCAYYFKLDISLQKTGYLKAFTDAQLHERGLLQSLHSYKDQLHELEKASQSELSKIKKSRAALDQHVEKLKNDSDELIKRQSSSVDRLKRHSFKLLSFWQKKARPQITDYLKSEVEGIKRYYSEELAMKSSVEYWRGKGEQYAEEMRRWQLAYYASAGILSGVLLLSVIVIVAALLMIGQETVDDLKIRIESLGRLQYFVGFLVTLTLLTVLWVIRMFARLYLASRDKMEDAQERVVMIQTYLSMIENDKNLNEAQSRSLILPVLFRPGNNSDSVDFPMPSKVMDSISNSSGQ